MSFSVIPFDSRYKDEQADYEREERKQEIQGYIRWH